MASPLSTQASISSLQIASQGPKTVVLRDIVPRNSNSAVSKPSRRFSVISSGGKCERGIINFRLTHAKGWERGIGIKRSIKCRTTSIESDDKAATNVTGEGVEVEEEEDAMYKFSLDDGESSDMEVDAVAEADLKANGYRSTRRTKLICTIGPSTCDFEALETLATQGMNVARLNMCHGDHKWHRNVIRSIKRLNQEKGFSVAIMMDTEGSEIHMGDFERAMRAENDEQWTFTVRHFMDKRPDKTLLVNYDGFVDDVSEGDEIVVDGGMVRFEVLKKIGPDVLCKVIDPGLLLPRANLTFFRSRNLVRGRNAMLPTISSKDWIDIDFALNEGVDFIAISFVKSADVLTQLRSYCQARSPDRSVSLIAKIESAGSLKNLREIIDASDGAMVARGDLGAQIPLEQVPSVQQEMVLLCRELNKPVIVASQLLESMIEFPTPTRAEVADISEAVRQRADSLMLSGESAVGLYPTRALSVLRTVATRIEARCREEKELLSSRSLDSVRTLGSGSGAAGWENTSSFRLGGLDLQQPASDGASILGGGKLPYLSDLLSERISEQICNAAAQMANELSANAIFVFTRRGYMASLLSRNRPDCPIFAFTATQDVRQHMNMYWGLIPFRIDFAEELETNLQRTFALLKARGMMSSGDLIVAVSDITSNDERSMVQSIQIRRVP